jgi:hypothetical protein
MTISKLENAIRRVRTQLEHYPPTGDAYGHMYSELATRYLLIDPIIWALDWDMNDFDQLAVEWAMPPGQYVRKADYVLFNRTARPVIVIEAKYHGRNLINHEAQLEGYTEPLRSGLGVLTDGIIWRIYNLRKRGEIHDRHVVTVDVGRRTISGETNDDTASVRELARCLNKWLDKDKWWSRSSI